MDDFKKVAIDLAYEAGKIIKQNFSIGMKKELKNDNTPVTATDIAVNKLVIETISTIFSDHSILSEEGSKIIQGSSYTWVCDPVDGTAAFSHGYPTFAFSLALTKDGTSILGVIYDPIVDRLLVAEKGKGATLNGNVISVSKIRSLEDKKTFINIDGEIKLLKLRELLIKNGLMWVSCLYSAVYVGLLVACGEYEAEIFEYKNPWDAAAVKVIVEEAGGKVTDLDGNDQRYDQKINGFVASNGLIHDEIIKKIQILK